MEVEVVGDDSEDESEKSDGGDEDESESNSDSSLDDDSTMTLPDHERSPSSSCYGRILLVQATRTTMQITKTIDLDGIGANFIPHVGIHPATYVNKILLGGRPTRAAVEGKAKCQPSMLLVNVRSGKIIHSFNGGTPIVTTLEQSPAIDTIAVGTSNGCVHLINTLHDVKLFTLRHKSKHPKLTNLNSVSSISFRTDGNATRQGVAPLAVGCDDGSVSVWDLTPVEDEKSGVTQRTLLNLMEGTHYGGVSKLEYLPGEPLLLSTGLASNSILLHVFDAPDHSGRILRQRKGHMSPPQLLRYLHPGLGGGGILANASDGTDASSCQILSCGGKGDLSLRVFSTARSNLDKEYSQGQGLERKARQFGKVGPEGRAELLLPEIIGLSTSEARSRDWGDLVTIHRNHAMAYVWSTKRGAQSGPVLRQPHWNISAMKERPPRSANATSLAISACGNFALVGTLGGVVYKYNLQSGLPRGSFPRDATSQTASHEDAVVGIAVDSLNKTMVTAGADSKLVLWSFQTHMPHKKSPILLPSPATKMCHVRDSDLAAIAMNDFGVAVFDCSSLAIVRFFGGSRFNHSPKERISHSGPISDMAFGPDGRKLFTSSFDGSIRVWDVPTGLCVDWMSFSSPPTSLALSPTGEFLATSHVGRLGISLWCDKSFFRMVLLDGTPNEASKMNEPCPVAECEQESDDANEDEAANDGIPPVAKEEGLITLSGLPPGHWKNLFHLELVKERNKPTEAPQKPPQAPFFLQWREGLETNKTKEAMADDPLTQPKRRKVVHHRSRLAELLQNCYDAKDPASVGEIYSDVTSYLSKMGPSSIDVEISSLCYGAHDLEDGLPLLHLAALWLLESCENRQSFEAINAYLHRFLHVHGVVIARLDDALKSEEGATEESIEEEDPRKLKLREFIGTISQLREKQKSASNLLQGKMQHTICLLRHLSRMV
ncbi:WD40-repeat protein [Thalassiosira pseudonana CCMP1335]|uniref:WD40-repeat protein n=1 Tax=Thalassiosira pseudonana TaxID=35128 RepID=B8BU98_THAPS|nr:WD40-repeat protein [Thalassiosira pseudonana CCMP1335]EED95247.1 WD40-repeat protein [Thalassiosira pseudonana CCMP1335]